MDFYGVEVEPVIKDVIIHLGKSKRAVLKILTRTEPHKMGFTHECFMYNAPMKFMGICGLGYNESEAVLAFMEVVAEERFT